MTPNQPNQAVPVSRASLPAAARRWTLAWLLLQTVQGLLPAATVSLTRLLVDRQLQIEAWLAQWHRARLEPRPKGRSRSERGR